MRIWLIVLALFVQSKSFAAEFPAKGRIFIGSNSSSPADLNAEMTTQNFKTFSTVTKYGTDITYALNNIIDVGFRYEKINQTNLESVVTANQNYQATLSQDAVLGIARGPLIKNQNLKADAFLGIGVSNTTFSMKNATQDGQLSTGNYNSPVAEAGLTFGAGYKNVFLTFEAGYVYNKVSGLQKSGTITSSMSSIDLSGPFLTIGLAFDGITATSK